METLDTQMEPDRLLIRAHFDVHRYGIERMIRELEYKSEPDFKSAVTAALNRSEGLEALSAKLLMPSGI